MKFKNFLKFLISSIVDCLKEGRNLEPLAEEKNNEEIKERN